MAQFGEIRAITPTNGRAFNDILSYTHYDGFKRGYDRRGITPPESIDDVAEVHPLIAHISQDTWVVDCPDCGGADVVFRAAMVLWCHECGNASLGGKWRPVRLPERADEIEALLDKRPRAEWRNWRPNETIEQLRMQNAERGDPV